jgi:hypothetical protein
MPACSRSDRRPRGPLSSVRPWLALALLPLSSGCGSDRVANPVADAGLALELRSALASTMATTSESVAAESGTGWGSLKGRFVFAGAAGDPRVLVVDKDTEVCSKEGVKLLDRSLLVDGSSKGVANVVIFARKTGRVRNPVPDTTLVFDQKNCEFLAPVFAARVGQPIDVRNSDPIGHNTNIAGTSFNQLIPAGAGTVYKADAETGMPTMVTCNIHPWMKAFVVFRKDGYVAVSATDGSFTLPDLPAGETVELQVWHERSTGPSGALGLDRPDLKWTPKGRFQVRLEPDEVKDLGTLEIPASALGI